MKKFLLYILLFFGIVAVADFAFGYACEWLQNHAKGGRMKGVRQAALVQTADIVVMGSSRAHHHYIPTVIKEETCLTAYNAGVDGNGIVLATGLYEMITERYHPTIILYEVTPEFDINVFSDDDNNVRYLGWLRPYYDNINVRSIITQIDPVERYKDLSSMFRYNSKFFDLIKDQFVISDYTADGYAPLKGVMTTERVYKNKPIAPVDSLKINMLEKLMVKTKQTGINLIMVASPKYGERNSDVFVYVKELCDKHGIEFWDYYTTSEYQKMEYFKEFTHLNPSGANIYSAAIAKRISQYLKQD